uniref:SJCHGC06936 protein n=1 Tax=Schistosoma japonicum TaxID=6182 RepID=Q5DH81_SCHJA|nr:SJCHGC06936 protein [Schistosoma japonicum]
MNKKVLVVLQRIIFVYCLQLIYAVHNLMLVTQCLNVKEYMSDSEVATFQQTNTYNHVLTTTSTTIMHRIKFADVDAYTLRLDLLIVIGVYRCSLHLLMNAYVIFVCLR